MFRLISLISLFVSTTFAAPKPILIPGILTQEFEYFEPSAAVYVPALKRFLVASDDTNEADEPFLFLMNERGQLEEEAIAIEGIEKMTDIESMSVDEDGNLYLLSSLGLNKKGKDLPERNLFIRAQIHGHTITATHSIYLRRILLQAITNSKVPELKMMSAELEESFDVESSFIHNEELYVGMKEPQPEGGKAVILNLGNVDTIFRTKKIPSIKIWKLISFESVSGEADLLSDMHLSGNRLLLTTTQEEGAGRFWSFDLNTHVLNLLEIFEDENPEAIAIVPGAERALILFDQGEENPLFTYSPLL